MEFSNEHFELAWQATNNRITFKIKGFCADEHRAEEYLEWWREVLDVAPSGFTILGDLTEMKVPSEEVLAVLQQIQELVVDAGLRKAAEVVSEAILSLAVDRIALASGIIVSKRQFHDAAAAVAWLDSDED